MASRGSERPVHQDAAEPLSVDAPEQTKVPLNVPDFPVKVLGGTFTVRQVLHGQWESRDDVLSVLRATPADRWFVMVSDDEVGQQDSLAMLDDDLEIQIYALGVLRQD